MPVISIPVRMITAMVPLAGGKSRSSIIIEASMTHEQVQATLNSMAEVINEQAWREMVEKTFEEPVQPRQNHTQGEEK